MAGNGATAVWVFIVPFAMISAMTSPTTSSTAAPAAIHNQRGDLGPSGGGGASRVWWQFHPAGAGLAANTAATVGSGSVSFEVGAHGDGCAP